MCNRIQFAYFSNVFRVRIFVNLEIPIMLRFELQQHIHIERLSRI